MYMANISNLDIKYMKYLHLVCPVHVFIHNFFYYNSMLLIIKLLKILTILNFKYLHYSFSISLPNV